MRRRSLFPRRKKDVATSHARARETYARANTHKASLEWRFCRMRNHDAISFPVRRGIDCAACTAFMLLTVKNAVKIFFTHRIYL